MEKLKIENQLKNKVDLIVLHRINKNIKEFINNSKKDNESKKDDYDITDSFCCINIIFKYCNMFYVVDMIIFININCNDDPYTKNTRIDVHSKNHLKKKPTRKTITNMKKIILADIKEIIPEEIYIFYKQK